jgi:hypothetical protein
VGIGVVTTGALIREPELIFTAIDDACGIIPRVSHQGVPLVEPAADLVVFNEFSSVGLFDCFADCDAERFPAQLLPGYA